MVVPFLHVTTKIEGHPFDGLLKEKGFGGFPSLAFMDAEGKVMAKPADRSVKSFRETLTSLSKYQDLKSRSDKGEKGLEYALFVAEWELGSLDFENAKTRAEGMGKLSKEQRATVEQIVKDADVLATAGTVRDEPSANEAGKRFHGMLEAGYRPGPKAERSFWGLLARWADENEKVTSLEMALEWMSKYYADQERMAPELERLRARVAELKAKAGAKP